MSTSDEPQITEICEDCRQPLAVTREEHARICEGWPEMVGTDDRDDVIRQLIEVIRLQGEMIRKYEALLDKADRAMGSALENIDAAIRRLQ